MAKQQTEDELNLRRKARRRLIGAVALTLAVVVILPMVLDSEPKISGKDIDLTIPDPNRVGKFVPRAKIPDSTLPSAASAVPASSDNAPAGESDAGKQNAVPVKEQPSLQKEKEAEDTSRLAGTDGFVAQVGAYSNQETAKQELKKLKQWGFKAYTEQTGDKTRVRVGPYPDRDKAEKVGHLLEKHGYHPVIVSAK
ncbi:MAG TPA: SPOR domain-containing protein [Gallionella sp.]|nr:SPOR domain-containing protein [Gallionella sp.]